MPLLGPAAMLLSFDVAEEALSEHDHWHTHEHVLERVAALGPPPAWLETRGTHQVESALYRLDGALGADNLDAAGNARC